MPTSVLPTYTTTAAHRACSPLHKSAKPFNSRGSTVGRFSHFEKSPPHTRNEVRRSALRVVVGAIALQSELLHSIDQCLAAEVQVLGCVGLVPVELLERPNDQFLLDRFQADAAGRKVKMKLTPGRASPP